MRVDNSVWTWLCREKLDTLKLSTAAVVDRCFISAEPVQGKTRLVICHADNAHQDSLVFGTVIHNVNTANEFREFDRKGMFGALMSCQPGDVLMPRLYVVVFADLKTYTFNFNVAVPSVNPSEYDFACGSISNSDRAEFPEAVFESSDRVVVLSSSGIVRPFSANIVEDHDTMVVKEGSISCEPGNLPFYVRTYLSAIAVSASAPIHVSVLFISSSLTLFKDIEVQPTSSLRVVPSWVKWPHPTTLQPTTVQSVDLKRFLDPATIAAESVLLNVKLIKWRLIPSIEPERMSSLRVLLIGAGTLGCAVGRCLQSWGVSNITFVDCGIVSYSNPPRQWLFTLDDAVQSAPKAATAAARMKSILPHSNIVGIDLAVPLPGHPADLTTLDESHDELKSLVESHDVVFMLTDSRESRWLPTLLVAAAQTRSDAPPLGVSVALGFDSYLVKTQSFKSQKSACYFCNDVSAPSDQTGFRTLDQQCTVTRPGLAAIASCMAVELVASMTQATAGFNSTRSTEDNGTSVLGAIPDQIRGFLGNFQSFPAVTGSFEKCICCSKSIVDDYLERGVEMVREVVADSAALTRISGLDEFKKNGDDIDVIAWSDDEL